MKKIVTAASVIVALSACGSQDTEPAAQSTRVNSTTVAASTSIVKAQPALRPTVVEYASELGQAATVPAYTAVNDRYGVKECADAKNSMIRAFIGASGDEMLPESTTVKSVTETGDRGVSVLVLGGNRDTAIHWDYYQDSSVWKFNCIGAFDQ